MGESSTVLANRSWCETSGRKIYIRQAGCDVIPVWYHNRARLITFWTSLHRILEVSVPSADKFYLGEMTLTGHRRNVQLVEMFASNVPCRALAAGLQLPGRELKGLVGHDSCLP